MRAIVYHTYGSPDVLELKEQATVTGKAFNSVKMCAH